ncbi:MAG: hypothetical protein HRT90_05735 [Candidatus Margulisbacteria bacterium]|nr:hypothetical protein [Candidatus Margulisiibacteriota bacterium]
MQGIPRTTHSHMSPVSFRNKEDKSPPNREDTQKSIGASRITASLTKGIPISWAFHPVESGIKRHQRVIGGQSNYGNLFPEIKSPTPTVRHTLPLLCRGMAMKTWYKTGQIPYKYTATPLLKQIMIDRYSPEDGLSSAQIMAITAIVGSATGFAEAYILGPWEFAVTRQQAGHTLTNLGKSIRKKPMIVFTGAQSAGLRNSVGSGIRWVVSDGLLLAMGLDYKHASLMQLTMVNTVAEGLSLTASGPFDLLKNRIQMEKKLGGKKNLLQMAKNIIAKEGLKALWKGQGLKFGVATFKSTILKTAIDYYSSRNREESL